MTTRRNTSNNLRVSETIIGQIAADVEAAIEAGTERLKALASRLPGGDANNYKVVLCEFLASEYGWGLDRIAGVDDRQMTMFVEQALRRRAQSSRRRAGRPRKSETDKDRLVIAALMIHRRYQSGGSISNHMPAKTAQLAKLASSKQVAVSVATVSRFFQKRFPGLGYKGYKNACVRGEIGMKLALWQGDIPERLTDLLPGEYGRGEDD